MQQRPLLEQKGAPTVPFILECVYSPGSSRLVDPPNGVLSCVSQNCFISGDEEAGDTGCPIKRGNVLENFPVLRCMSTANKNIHLFEQQSALNGRKAKDTI